MFNRTKDAKELLNNKKRLTLDLPDDKNIRWQDRRDPNVDTEGWPIATSILVSVVVAVVTGIVSLCGGMPGVAVIPLVALAFGVSLFLNHLIDKNIKNTPELTLLIRGQVHYLGIRERTSRRVFNDGAYRSYAIVCYRYLDKHEQAAIPNFIDNIMNHWDNDRLTQRVADKVVELAELKKWRAHEMDRVREADRIERLRDGANHLQETIDIHKEVTKELFS